MAGIVDLWAAGLMQSLRPDVRTPAARATDPDTSHAAAAAVTKSGVRAHQQRQVLAALREWPGCTSAELARHACMDRYAVARRLPELVPAFAFQGATRRCACSGRPAVTWWAHGLPECFR